MAIYHLTAKLISRSSGSSIVASSAYRSGEIIKDVRTGITHDFTRKKGVDATIIYIPKFAPKWMRDRTKLWNTIEKIEVRKDAQLAREIEFSLPVELDEIQQATLVEEFVNDVFVVNGMVADVALHKLGTDNPHCHVLLSLRTVGPNGFANKERRWNSPDLLLAWRRKWANYANAALYKAGHGERIDHRTLIAQGIDREPQIHHGHVDIRVERNQTIIQLNEVRAKIAAEKSRLANLSPAEELAEAEHEELMARDSTAPLLKETERLASIREEMETLVNDTRTPDKVAQSKANEQLKPFHDNVRKAVQSERIALQAWVAWEVKNRFDNILKAKLGRGPGAPLWETKEQKADDLRKARKLLDNQKTKLFSQTKLNSIAKKFIEEKSSAVATLSDAKTQLEKLQPALDAAEARLKRTAERLEKAKTAFNHHMVMQAKKTPELEPNHQPAQTASNSEPPTEAPVKTPHKDQATPQQKSASPVAQNALQATDKAKQPSRPAGPVNIQQPKNPVHGGQVTEPAQAPNVAQNEAVTQVGTAPKPAAQPASKNTPASEPDSELPVPPTTASKPEVEAATQPEIVSSAEMENETPPDTPANSEQELEPTSPTPANKSGTVTRLNPKKNGSRRRHDEDDFRPK